MPVFNAAIEVQHRLIVPCRVACLGREEVPVVLVPVDRGDDHVEAPRKFLQYSLGEQVLQLRVGHAVVNNNL